HTHGATTTMNEQTKATYKPSIRHAGGTRYDVQSRTRPERTHHTDVYHLTCDCEAGSHGKRCWALALAISFDAWRRQEGKQARQAERATPPQQAADWSSTGTPARGSQTQANGALPVRQTGELAPLSGYFE